MSDILFLNDYIFLFDSFSYIYIKAETRRKRAHEVAPGPKTPVSAKKAKAEATPKKTGKD